MARRWIYYEAGADEQCGIAFCLSCSTGPGKRDKGEEFIEAIWMRAAFDFF